MIDSWHANQSQPSATKHLLPKFQAFFEKLAYNPTHGSVGNFTNTWHEDMFTEIFH